MNVPVKRYAYNARFVESYVKTKPMEVNSVNTCQKKLTIT